MQTFVSLFNYFFVIFTPQIYANITFAKLFGQEIFKNHYFFLFFAKNFTFVNKFHAIIITAGDNQQNAPYLPNGVEAPTIASQKQSTTKMLDEIAQE